MTQLVFRTTQEAQAAAARLFQDFNSGMVAAGFSSDAQGVIERDGTGADRPDAQRATAYAVPRPEIDEQGSVTDRFAIPAPKETDQIWANVLAMLGDVVRFDEDWSVVQSNGTEWVSLIDFNALPPEFDAARTRWQLETLPPDTEWYAGREVTVGLVLSYEGTQYEAIQAHRTQEGWEPNLTPTLWREVVPDASPWVQPTGSQDAYAIGDQVTHLNAQDGGTVWLFESNIAANTTEPGTDGTFHRWWRPIAPV